MRVRWLDELLVLQHPRTLSLKLSMSKPTDPYSLLREREVQGLTLSCFQIRWNTPLPHSLHFSHTDLLAVSSKCPAHTCLSGFEHSVSSIWNVPPPGIHTAHYLSFLRLQVLLKQHLRKSFHLFLPQSSSLFSFYLFITNEYNITCIYI